MKLVVMRKGGGGQVAINPEAVTFVRSAAGAFTDIFFDGQQVAVEGTFDEVVSRLSLVDRRRASEDQSDQGGSTFGSWSR